MSLYTELRTDVAALLAELKTGSVALLRTGGTEGTSALKAATTTDTTYTVNACVFGYSSEEIDDRRVLADDLQVIVGADGLAIVPTAQDSVTIDGVTHAVVNVEAVPGAGTVVAYFLQVRKS